MVEIAQRVIDALNRGDIPGAIKDTATDFAFDFSRSRSAERGVYGREDVVRLQEDFGGVWESVRYEPDEFIEAGDQIITPMTTYNRGRDGIEDQTSTAWLCCLVTDRSRASLSSRTAATPLKPSECRNGCLG